MNLLELKAGQLRQAQALRTRAADPSITEEEREIAAARAAECERRCEADADRAAAEADLCEVRRAGAAAITRLAQLADAHGRASVVPPGKPTPLTAAAVACLGLEEAEDWAQQGAALATKLVQVGAAEAAVLQRIAEARCRQAWLRQQLAIAGLLSAMNEFQALHRLAFGSAPPVPTFTGLDDAMLEAKVQVARASLGHERGDEMLAQECAAVFVPVIRHDGDGYGYVPLVR